MKVKPATFDGTGSWVDYKAHFHAVAETNGLNQTFGWLVVLGLTAL